MKSMAAILFALMAIGCSSPPPGLKAKIDASGTLTVTNSSGETLGYSGNLLGGLHRAEGDFYVSVRHASGEVARQCGVFDPFTAPQRSQLAPGDSVRFSTYPGQIGHLYCFSPGQRGTFTVQYAVQQAGNSKRVLLTSEPIEFVASNSEEGQSDPFDSVAKGSTGTEYFLPEAELLREEALARQGDASAAEKVADHHALGLNDPDASMEWRRMAARSGSVRAMRDMAKDLVMDPVAEANCSEARMWMSKAEKSSSDAEALVLELASVKSIVGQRCPSHD